MKSIVLDKDKLLVAQIGYDAETAPPDRIIFDSRVGPAGGLYRSGVILRTEAPWQITTVDPTLKLFTLKIPLGRTFLRPPGLEWGLVRDGVLHMTKGYASPQVAAYYIGQATTTDIEFIIKMQTVYPYVLSIGDNNVYDIAWAVYWS